MGSFNRRNTLKSLGLTGIGAAIWPFSSFPGHMTGPGKQSEYQGEIRSRPISSTGEMLPVVGLGTWIQFDVGTSDEDREPLRQVLSTMREQGGKVIDSSPMYGRSETVVGDLTQEMGDQADHFFYATKVWTSGQNEGIRQMQSSFQKMKRETMDLMQVHNLQDWKTHLQTMNQWKKEGKIRYTGVTHYTPSAHNQLEQIVKSKAVDFIQVNYSIIDRNAEKSLLPAAKDHGVAVIVNRPYASGNLFSKVKGKALPEWAMEYDIQSWGQFFLKFILSNDAVTCVIPGTSNPKHLLDNMGAGFGRLPEQNSRKKMVEYIENI
jgi:diketogulonate reductase-like aldo/keto reductase